MIVQTETAVYVLDGAAGMLTRYRRESDQLSHPPIAQLRKDGEPIPFEVIGELTVGQPAQFLLQIRDDGVETVRTTTPVVSIDG